MSSAASPSASEIRRNRTAGWTGLDRQLVTPAAHFCRYGWYNRLAAAVILIPGLPLIAVLSLITRLTSRGPGVYRQTRVGFKGGTFVLYKIRTMSQNAEAETGPVWSAGVADPRITRFGHFLRSTHLDELPQLFNVLKGEMSLVGPRPERPEFTQFLAQEIPGYVGRLVVRPGITGLAQINLEPDSDLGSVRKKLELDVEYITDSTLMTDARILTCTFLKMFGLKGNRLAKFFGLKRRPKGKSAASTPIGEESQPEKTSWTSLSRLNGNGNGVDQRTDETLIASVEETTRVKVNHAETPSPNGVHTPAPAHVRRISS